MNTEAKCNCQFCNKHVAFPVEMAGQMAECPHCHMETRLFIPPMPSVPVAKAEPHVPPSPPTPPARPARRGLDTRYLGTQVMVVLLVVGGLGLIGLGGPNGPGHGLIVIALATLINLQMGQR